MRIFIIVVLVLVVGLATTIGVLLYQDHRHSSAVERLYGVIRRSREAAPAGVNPDSWKFVTEGPYLYVANFMVSRRYCPTDKVVALADQFEAKWPRGPRSTADIRAMLDLLTTTLPKYQDAGWLENIRDSLKEIDDGLGAAGRK